MKKQFNTNDWLPPQDMQGKPQGQHQAPPGSSSPNDDQAAVERAIEAIEASGKDITAGYQNWIRLGFALTHFGEAGRPYFHRISRFNPDYDQQQCDRQYDHCLRSSGQGVTLGSFFHLLKEAGIAIPRSQRPAFPPAEIPDFVPPAPTGPPVIWMGDGAAIPIDDPEEEEEEPVEELPSFPQEVYDHLPPLLKETVIYAESPEERDILLLGSLACLSSALPNIYGFYRGRKVYPHLYLFVNAPASAGKGQLSLCKNLVEPVHEAKRARTTELLETYELQMLEYNANKDSSEKPVKPSQKMHFIPANNSSSGMFQLLADNDGEGLIFETEADTVTAALRSDYGNFSDMLRRGYQHEPISYYRKTDKEYLYVREPKMATVLSGTPRQVVSLIQDAENGLFSRFMFYYFNLKPVWKDVFAKNGERGIENHFLDLGTDFFSFHQQLQEQPPMRMVFSRSMQKEFNSYFESLQRRHAAVESEEFLSSIRRLGLSCFRIALILTALRTKDDQHWGKVRQCEVRDFKTAMIIAKSLVAHNSYVYYRLPALKKPQLRGNVKEKFLKALPAEFNRTDYLLIARKYKLSVRTADKYVAHFLEYGQVERVKHGEYILVA